MQFMASVISVKTLVLRLRYFYKRISKWYTQETYRVQLLKYTFKKK